MLLRALSRALSAQAGPASLLEHLRMRIRMSGPLTVHAFMREALTNPRFGYYMTRDVFGQEGDFITSPEISQVFGELIGVWIVNEWAQLGQKPPLNVVELGPGRGTLAMDVLRVLKKFPQVASPTTLHLIEVSPVMAYLQEAVLRGQPLPRSAPPELRAQAEDWSTGGASGPYKTVELEGGVRVSWYRELKQVPRMPACFVAHEFFDALPIHKFQKENGVWREILVDISQTDGNLIFVRSAGATPASQFYLQLLSPLPTRVHAEISPEAGVCAEEISVRLAEDGGVALIADYGHTGEKEDTFRAFKSHREVEPLAAPGEADLTADVDFAFLAGAAARSAPAVARFGPVTQASFLNNMGLGLRLQMLLRGAPSAEQRRLLISGCEKLVSPREMGERFKFLALRGPPTSAEAPADYRPAGFPLEDHTIG